MAGDDRGSLLGGLLGSGNGSSGSNILGALRKDSWVGTGANQSVTGAQFQQARAVDKLTPNGQVPAGLDELVKQQNL